MKIWITKYSLTSGIIAAEGERCMSTGNPDMIEVKGKPGSYPQYYHGEGRDWHTSFESAARKAEEMRLKKIKSYQNSIEKLLKLSFPATR